MGKKETFKQVVIDDGRITIPLVYRDSLGLKKGDVLTVTIQKEED